MSQYLILIRTVLTFDFVPGEPNHAYALTTTNYPPTGLSILQNYCPFALETVHTIHSGNQTDVLLQTLQIKYRKQLIRSFWYDFTFQEVSDIQALNERNFSQMIGFIQKQLRRPEMTQEEAMRLAKEQALKIENLLAETKQYESA